MRVIAGKARSLRLKTIEGDSTRPTTDRIKETLFNMLGNSVSGSDFLDLFSGSGAIGIEALSRGANSAVFIENNMAAVRCIRDNLTFTRLLADATVMCEDVMTAVSKLNSNGKRFDIVFMDPPYNHEFEKNLLIKISQTDIIDEDTLIIVEASSETKFDYVEQYGYVITKEKNYKTNKHVFIKKA